MKYSTAFAISSSFPTRRTSGLHSPAPQITADHFARYARDTLNCRGNITFTRIPQRCALAAILWIKPISPVFVVRVAVMGMKGATWILHPPISSFAISGPTSINRIRAYGLRNCDVKLFPDTNLFLKRGFHSMFFVSAQKARAIPPLPNKAIYTGTKGLSSTADISTDLGGLRRLHTMEETPGWNGAMCTQMS